MFKKEYFKIGLSLGFREGVSFGAYIGLAILLLLFD